MTPHKLLDQADAILTRHHPSMRRCWQRACATLTRLALELALDRYWRQRLHTDPPTSMRTRLLVLPVIAGDEVATLARSAWNGLCTAVHHHAYEVAPTAAELRGWHSDVATLLARRDGAGRQAAPSESQH